jgi:hypothetical protein
MTTINCQCECGHTRLTVSGAARLRMLCHCTICQRFNRASHADVLVFHTKQVTLADPASVDFKTYKPPPNVNRGVCQQCRQPAIEVFAMPLMPKLTMVPAAMFSDPSALPEPCAHMFYEHRQQDVDDDLPKVKGFVRSQWLFFRRLWFGR